MQKVSKKIEGEEFKKMNLYKKAIETWGAERQKQKAIEELSELIRAIARDDRDNVIEEISDVITMIKQLRILYNITLQETHDSFENKQKKMRYLLETEKNKREITKND
jgi:NTP pyrophosphatase (non-canonical NTP hydrolase)